MTRKTKARMIVCTIICTLLVSALLWRMAPVTLHLGLYTGGSWDVPSAATYDFVDGIIERFERDHPRVRVVYDSGIIHEDYEEWMAQKILTGDCPDVFLILEKDFDRYVQTGVLKNLNPYLSDDDTFHASDYYPGTLENGRCRYRQFALPFEYNPELMFVNVSLLEKEGIPIPENGWTLDDLFCVCTQATRDTDGNGIIDQFGIYGYSWKNVFDAYGIDLYDHDGNADLDQDAVREAVDWLDQLEQLSENASCTLEDLDEGKVVFAPMSYAEFITYNPYPWRIKRYSNFDWLCVPMPCLPGKTASYGGSSLYMGVSARTLHAGLSWELLKSFCCDAQSQTEVVTQGLGVSPFMLDPAQPALNEYYEKIGIPSSLIDQIMEKASCGRTVYDERTFTILDTRLNSLLEGDGDLELGLMQIQNELNNTMRE